LDFLHAFRPASLAMLARAKPRQIFDGAHTVRVADPEDVIGLKVQAIANNPDRQHQDRADIERLMDQHREALDWKRIEEYYQLFGMDEEGQQLRKRFGDVE